MAEPLWILTWTKLVVSITRKLLGPFLMCQQIDQFFFIMKVTSWDIFR